MKLTDKTATLFQFLIGNIQLKCSCEMFAQKSQR